MSNNSIDEQIELNLRIYLDGDQVCVLQGWNIQEGIAGFGPTVREALTDFAEHYTQESKVLKDHPWAFLKTKKVEEKYWMGGGGNWSRGCIRWGCEGKIKDGRCQKCGSREITPGPSEKENNFFIGLRHDLVVAFEAEEITGEEFVEILAVEEEQGEKNDV